YCPPSHHQATVHQTTTAPLSTLHLPSTYDGVVVGVRSANLVEGVDVTGAAAIEGVDAVDNTGE
ncbi:hypothetical protein A2U01_0065362, partial [Trifolium medium]|nr:hypothetical protein [Trifolium medium]